MGTTYNGKPGNESRLGALTVTGATNATPIEITTSAAHGLYTGDRVQIVGVRGNTAANGTWTITKTAASTFTLAGSVGNGAWAAGGTQTATYLGLMPRVTLPDDGVDLRSAAALNIPNEDAKDAQAYLAERVGSWRVVDWRVGQAAFSFAAKLASITTYDTDFDGAPALAQYIDVQPGDRVEYDFGPFLVTAGTGDLEVKMAYDITEYGAATGHAFTDGIALVTVKANTKVPVHFHNAFEIGFSPTHGARIYPSFRGYDAGGSNWGCDASGANYSIRVWRQN